MKEWFQNLCLCKSGCVVDPDIFHSVLCVAAEGEQIVCVFVVYLTDKRISSALGITTPRKTTLGRCSKLNQG